MTSAGKIQILFDMVETKLITLKEAQVLFYIYYNEDDAFYVNCELEWFID